MPIIPGSLPHRLNGGRRGEAFAFSSHALCPLLAVFQSTCCLFQSKACAWNGQQFHNLWEGEFTSASLSHLPLAITPFLTELGNPSLQAIQRAKDFQKFLSFLFTVWEHMARGNLFSWLNHHANEAESPGWVIQLVAGKAQFPFRKWLSWRCKAAPAAGWRLLGCIDPRLDWDQEKRPSANEDKECLLSRAPRTDFWIPSKTVPKHRTAAAGSWTGWVSQYACAGVAIPWLCKQ